jgi:hypothetical protein
MANGVSTGVSPAESDTPLTASLREVGAGSLRGVLLGFILYLDLQVTNGTTVI